MLILRLARLKQITSEVQSLASCVYNGLPVHCHCGSYAKNRRKKA